MKNVYNSDIDSLTPSRAPAWPQGAASAQLWRNVVFFFLRCWNQLFAMNFGEHPKPNRKIPISDSSAATCEDDTSQPRPRVAAVPTKKKKRSRPRVRVFWAPPERQEGKVGFSFLPFPRCNRQILRLPRTLAARGGWFSLSSLPQPPGRWILFELLPSWL